MQEKEESVHQDGCFGMQPGDAKVTYVASGCVKRPLCIAGMTRKELTIFISESMFTRFECIILIIKGIPTQLWLPKITTCIDSRKLYEVIKAQFQI